MLCKYDTLRSWISKEIVTIIICFVVKELFLSACLPTDVLVSVSILFPKLFSNFRSTFCITALVHTAMSCDSETAYIKFSYSVTRVADDNCSLENSTNWVFCESFFFKVYITCYWVYRILLTIVFNAVCDGELIWKSDSYFNYYSCVRSGFSWWSHKQFCPLNAPTG